MIIAGIRGGSGKTTLSLGLTAALSRQKGLKVVPFKKGPDYIDAGWMSVAAQNPCYNLDPFLISKEKVRESFIAHSRGDVAIIEGNRGLYDGMDVEGSYSTAELAKLLKAPVLLIVDCTKMTRTTAAVVLGCLNMDREVNIKGVVLNQVSGARHEAVVRAAVEKYCAVPVLGAIPRMKDGKFPERHMGLTPYHEHHATEGAIAFVEQAACKHLNLDAILKVAQSAEPLTNGGDQLSVTGNELKEKDSGNSLWITDYGSRLLRVGVIRDSAFQFYYPENLEELERHGVELVDINALTDPVLPDIDALYIGGGFPETNAIRLAGNSAFRDSLRNMAEKGLPVYAECGGLMFLGEAIVVGGERYPMVGIFPITFEMKKKPQAHGYTVVEVERENPFYPTGTVLHGHEFHYSAVTGMTLTPPNPPLAKGGRGGGVYTAFGMKRGYGIKDEEDGICYKNVLGTYTHIHALGTSEWVTGMVRKAGEFRASL